MKNMGPQLQHNSLAFLALLSACTVLAQENTSAAANTTDSFFTDENGTSANDPSNPSTPDPDVAGAAGPEKSGINLSRGSIIAIGVVVGVVVILGLTSAVLFYVAKKRQWEVRKSLRRSTRRVTTAIRAHTPVRTNFSKRDKAALRVDPPGHKSNRQYEAEKQKRTTQVGVSSLQNGRSTDRADTRLDRDLEKGYGARTKSRNLTPPPAPEARKTSFGDESPLKGSPDSQDAKGNGGSWSKMFGRNK